MATPTREGSSKTIGEYTFYVALLPASKGDKLSYKIPAAVTQVLVNVADADEAGDDSSSIATGIGALRATLDEGLFEEVKRAMLSVSTVEGGDLKARCGLERAYDEVFTGNYTLLWQWLWFALRTNFADFFEHAETLFKSEHGSREGDSAENPLAKLLSLAG